MTEGEKQLSGYQKYLKRKQEEMDNPKPPSQQEYIRLNEKGRSEYMKHIRKAYEMMLFWMGFGGFLGYMSYSLAPQFKWLRNRPSFKGIRIALVVLPICVFSYHGIKFMVFYKRKGAREVAKDASNLMSKEEYERHIEEQSAVKRKETVV